MPPRRKDVCKHPADVVSNSVHVMNLLTGEAEDTLAPDDVKDPAARALGAEGGTARAAKMAPEPKRNE